MNCPKCNNLAPSEGKFCPSCGWNLSRSYSGSVFKPATLGAILVATLALFAGTRLIQYVAPIGKAPSGNTTSPSAGMPHAEAESSDPALTAFRKAAEAEPNNKDRWHDVAARIDQLLGETETPSTDLVFEAIGALRKILDIDPNDSWALLGMADLSFNQEAPAKAVEFYERYLKQNPNETEVRVRYGGALALAGRVDDSVKELNGVLKGNPKHFQASAYLTLAYAQKGDTASALKSGNVAIELAPNDEARARFSDFLLKIKEGGNKASPKDEAPSAPAEEAEAIITHVKTNQVAGPKFVKGEMREKGELALVFNAFPMDKMPPFVREKFLNGIREKWDKRGGIKRVSFIDEATGKEMASLE